MKPPHQPASPDGAKAARRVLPPLAGGFFGLALLRFGNPPIMEKWVEAPTDLWQFLLWSTWPINWGYALLTGLTILSLWSIRWKWPKPRWPLGLLLVWLAWQFLAILTSVDADLSTPTVAHFTSCVMCFLLGCLCLPPVGKLGSFFTALLAGYLLVLGIGFQQQFGGLEAARQHFFAEIYPHMKEVSPDYLKKIMSPRIFSTLFYPNSLAGAILLVTPPVLVLLAQGKRLFTAGARVFLVGCVSAASLACLVWSGSKGGWLLMLLMGLVALLRLGFRRWLKVALLGTVLVAGMGAFAWKYHQFFQKGATSVVARFDYWNAAVKTAFAHPLVGTGPGTFARPYRAIKRPESEMARLAHNDYLEQASDSGWLAFLAYAGFIAGSLIYGFPRSNAPAAERVSAEEVQLRFALWLGVLGWALQSVFEFGLYIPALAWPAFCFLGLLNQPQDRIAETGRAGPGKS